MPNPIPLKIEFSGTPILEFDRRKLNAALRRAGTEVATLARSLIRKGSPGGRFYSVRQHGGLSGHQSSAPGQPPASRTGALAGSITVRTFRKGIGIRIIAREYYGKFLETGAKGGGPRRRNTRRQRGGVRTIYHSGTRVMAPRPYLTTALDMKRGSLEARLRSAVLEGAAWKRER